MTPERGDLSNDSESSTDRLPEDESTYILPPDETDGAEGQHLQFWGRFWGKSRGLYVAVALDLNLDKNRFREKNFYLTEDAPNLESFEPGRSFDNFVNKFSGKSTHYSIPDATVKQVKQKVRSNLADERDNQFIDALENQDEDILGDIIFRLVGLILTKGDFTYEINAKLATPDATNDARGESKQTGNSSSDKTDESDDQTNYISVKPVTSPMRGSFPSDLTPGTEVFVRTDGEITQNLPDELQSDEQENLSVPLESTVQGVTPDVDLPANFDGDPENYWEISVTLLDSASGKSLVHKDTQIKTPGQDDEKEQSGNSFSPLILIGAGLSLLASVILAYLMFGL